MGKRILRYVGRFFAFLLITLGMLLAGLWGVICILADGPSPAAQKLFVLSVKETSAVGFLADIFFTEEEIKAMVESGADDTDEITDASLVEISKEPVPEGKDLELVEISGGSYRGKMLIIKDPSRVFVGTSGAYGEEYRGTKVSAMVERYGCIAGTNAGGFQDENGMGAGGVPLGMVISEGALKWGNLDAQYEIIGFDKNDVLYVGRMTGHQALEAQIRDAVCFGPALIVNGTPRNINSSLGGGLNPRTAIGQRADGTVLLLVIDGRQASSLGATYDDLVSIMTEYGAVNAANLDGGSSSHMVYDGEIITKCSSLYGPRDMPTSILIK